ncbi:MAG: cell division protein ZipA [Gammaproteobacteria bacterium]
MLSLRLVLIAISVVLIAVLWIRGARRSAARRYRYVKQPGRPGRRRRERLSAAEDHLDAVEALAESAGAVPDAPQEDADTIARSAPEAPVQRGRPADAQLELGFDAQFPGPAVQESEPSPQAMVLFVEVDEPRRIRGTDLVEALESVGLQYGDLGAFHHHGIGQLRSVQPIFSVANMFEPGTIDPARSAELATLGVVLILQLPAPVDATVAFELMLNTAQRLAEILDGTVRDDRHLRMTPERIAALRAATAPRRR